MRIDYKLFGLLFLNLIINAAISIIAPFYPSEASQRGISEDIVGFVFAALPLGGFCFSLIFGKYMRFWGRKKLLFLGMVLLIIGFLMFALIDFTENQAIFLSVSVAGRVIQGLGLSAYTSVSYAYLPLLYNEEELSQKIGYMEATTGIGMLIAPIFGSLLDSAWGYQCPFYVMSAILLIFSPWLIRSLPADSLESLQEKKPLSLRKVLGRRKILLTYAMSAVVMAGFSFIEPVFAEHLKGFQLGIVEIGLVFSLGTLSYTIFMVIIGAISQKFRRPHLIVLGSVFYIISFLLLGPENYFGFPRSLALICVGMAILGFGATLTVLPIIPEFIELCEEVYKNEKIAVGDLSSGMFDSSILVGGLVGPIMGGYFTSFMGFPHACSTFAIILLGFVIVYCMFGDVFRRASKEKTQEINEKNEEITDNLL